jgi:hypothetical protein
MIKKFFKLSLIFILFIPIFIDGKAMLEENFKREIKKTKSETTALYWSLGATLIPIALGFKLEENVGDKAFIVVTLGLIVGPSAGHFYAEQMKRGLKSTGLRLGLSVITLIALGQASGSGGGIYGYPSSGMGIIALGAGIVAVGSAVYDIFTAPRSARKHNELIKKTGNVYFIPKIDIKEESCGLSVVYCF